MIPKIVLTSLLLILRVSSRVYYYTVQNLAFELEVLLIIDDSDKVMISITTLSSNTNKEKKYIIKWKSVVWKQMLRNFRNCLRRSVWNLKQWNMTVAYILNPEYILWQIFGPRLIIIIEFSVMWGIFPVLFVTSKLLSLLLH